MHEQPVRDDYAAAVQRLSDSEKILRSGDYGVVVLDQTTPALYYGVCCFDELKKALRNRAPYIEAFIPGPHAPPALLEMADPGTGMIEITHYCTREILARARHKKIIKKQQRS